MRKLSLISAVLILMTAFVWTSCIDNEVAPEVAAIRAAQVNLINARTAFVEAETALKNAQAAYQIIVNDKEKATLADQLAQNAKKAAEYAVAVKQAELDLQEAIDALAKYIATNKIALAGEYLSEFEWANWYLADLIADKANAQYDLDDAKLLLTYDWVTDEYLPYDLIKDRLERQLAKENAELAADQASLTAMQAVAANPATIQAALATLEGKIADLENKQLALDIDYAKADTAWNRAYANYYGGWTSGGCCSGTYVDGVINDLNNYSWWLANNESNVASWKAQVIFYTQAVADYNAQITSLTNTLATANAKLTTANTNLTSAKAAQSAKQTAYNTAKATFDAKFNALTIANANVDIAQANFDADGSPANQTALTNAQTAQTTAQNEYNTANTALGTAQTNLTAANNNVSQYLTAVVNATNDVNTATQNLVSAKQNLRDAEASLVDFNNLIVSNEAEGVVLLAAYNKAKANEAPFLAAYKAADAAYDAINVKWEANRANLANYYELQNYYEDFLDVNFGANSAIEAKKAEVQSGKEDVAVTTAQISNIVNDKAEATNLIAYYQSRVDDLTARIAAQTKVVAKWKALLDAALG